MTQNSQQTAADTSEMGSLLLGAGFALASLIILPAVAQRIGLGSSLTIALRGALTVSYIHLTLPTNREV